MTGLASNCCASANPAFSPDSAAHQRAAQMPPKAGADSGNRDGLILPRRGHYVQDTHDITLRLYCG